MRQGSLVRISLSRIFRSSLSLKFEGEPFCRGVACYALSRSMMVSSGLAGAHVQPCPRIKFLRVMLSGERGSRSEARSESKHPCLKVLTGELGFIGFAPGRQCRMFFEFRGFWFMLETNRACSSGG